MLDYRESLRRVGWSDRVEAAFSHLHNAGLTPARVVGVERDGCRTVAPTGELMVSTTDLAVGDWVGLDADRVVDRIDRWSQLERLDPDGNPQVLAANVDIVLIAAPADRLSLARVERELLVAWDSGAQPVVVITKLDLADTEFLSVVGDRLVTTDVVATSTVDGVGLNELAARLGHPNTAALIGPSGAGKSTLINALLGEQRLAVGAVRAGDRRGRHTSSSRCLVSLPSAGCLIDMPGMRSLATAAGDEALAQTFPDIAELAAGCRFTDCQHDREPGCAVLGALEDGVLDSQRIDSFRKLHRQADHERRRLDVLARHDEQRLWKARTKAWRQSPKYRNQGGHR